MKPSATDAAEEDVQCLFDIGGADGAIGEQHVDIDGTGQHECRRQRVDAVAQFAAFCTQTRSKLKRSIPVTTNSSKAACMMIARTPLADGLPELDTDTTQMG